VFAIRVRRVHVIGRTQKSHPLKKKIIMAYVSMLDVSAWAENVYIAKPVVDLMASKRIGEQLLYHHRR
jgi:hypothetical protein